MRGRGGPRGAPRGGPRGRFPPGGPGMLSVNFSYIVHVLL